MLSNAVFTLIVCCAAGVVWGQHRKLAALRAELARKNAAILESFERENAANARAHALRRALDAAHEAQAAQAAQAGEPRTCRRAPVPPRDDYALALPAANGAHLAADLVRHLRITDRWLRVPLYAGVLSTHSRH